ncbi:hypothetical protein K2224_14130 [Streptomyces sp. BHT-5-2]|uniref:4'-phosphopantetheinyl transferase family protein n=1 Tax=Streptomyces sp. BHT-5-2 TaxID=2866715 RepID=UPI001C8D4E82|nr:hypothetical protein [Streptomyces sp. BHT-5-2]QZL04196.1 hypothetical protein K2224_14130 [Streptomyces sp. BHT-5-2]
MSPQRIAWNGFSAAGITGFEIASQVWISLRRSDDIEHSIAAAGAQRCRQSDAVRALLRQLMVEVAPEAADARLARTPAGAPVIEAHPDVHISLSHDGNWVAAAVGRGRAVGVDVQVPVGGSGGRLVRRCAGRYAGLLEVLPSHRLDEEIAWVWSVQEACVKARGVGLQGRPWTLDIPPFTTSGRIGSLCWRSLRGSAPVPLAVAYEG